MRIQEITSLKEVKGFLTEWMDRLSELYSLNNDEQIIESGFYPPNFEQFRKKEEMFYNYFREIFRLINDEKKNVNYLQMYLKGLELKIFEDIKNLRLFRRIMEINYKLDLL